jgi:hypothetical protein
MVKCTGWYRSLLYHLFWDLLLCTEIKLSVLLSGSKNDRRVAKCCVRGSGNWNNKIRQACNYTCTHNLFRRRQPNCHLHQLLCTIVHYKQWNKMECTDFKHRQRNVAFTWCTFNHLKHGDYYKSSLKGKVFSYFIESYQRIVIIYGTLQF